MTLARVLILTFCLVASGEGLEDQVQNMEAGLLFGRPGPIVWYNETGSYRTSLPSRDSVGEYSLLLNSVQEDTLKDRLDLSENEISRLVEVSKERGRTEVQKASDAWHALDKSSQLSLMPALRLRKILADGQGKSLYVLGLNDLQIESVKNMVLSDQEVLLVSGRELYRDTLLALVGESNEEASDLVRECFNPKGSWVPSFSVLTNSLDDAGQVAFVNPGDSPTWSRPAFQLDDLGAVRFEVNLSFSLFDWEYGILVSSGLIANEKVPLDEVKELRQRGLNLVLDLQQTTQLLGDDFNSDEAQRVRDSIRSLLLEQFDHLYKGLDDESRRQLSLARFRAISLVSGPVSAFSASTTKDLLSAGAISSAKSSMQQNAVSALKRYNEGGSAVYRRYIQSLTNSAAVDDIGLPRASEFERLRVPLDLLLWREGWTPNKSDK